MKKIMNCGPDALYWNRVCRNCRANDNLHYMKYKAGQHPNSKKGLKPIKEGEVRNPLGYHSHDPVKKELKKFSTDYLKKIIEASVMGTTEDLDNLINDPTATAIEVAVAKVVVKGIKSGDWDIIEKVLARAVGKLPDKFDHTTNGENIPGAQFNVTFVKPK